MSERICPTCLGRQPRDTERCPADRENLLDLGEGDPRIGSAVAEGRFLILDVLGRGGMGVVYDAWQRSIQRRVALKVLPAELAAEREFLKRFKREALVTARLKCPHTIQVYDSGELADGALYLCMELLEGRTLRSVLTEEGTLSPSRAVALLQQICLSLEEAHAGGLVHRDLKPANVMVVGLGRGREFVKVLDFGIAKVLGAQVTRLTRKGSVFGTPVYMSPEQFEAREIGSASDIYSLGVMLYELVSGRPPHEADSEIALMVKHCTTPPPRLAPTLAGSAMVEALDAVIQKCMARKPQDRYASAADLRADLERLTASAAPAVPAAQPVPRPPLARSAWRIVALAVAASAAVAAALVAAELINAEKGDTGGEGSAVVDNGAGGPGSAAQVWPGLRRLLVVPPASAPEREADRTLWPLFDRMVVNALDADERFWARLERVDPARVESETRRREMVAPHGTADIDELAVSLGASLVLEGVVRREGGGVRWTGALRSLDGRARASVEASGPTAPAAAEDVAAQVRSVLGFGASESIPPTRLRELLLKQEPLSRALAGVRASQPAAERRGVIDGYIREVPDAVGASWLRFVENVEDDAAAAALSRVAAGVDDDELRRFLEEVGNARTRPGACEGIDLAALGARHPFQLGPLAEAACLVRRGRTKEAADRAIDAHADLRLRPLARPFVLRLAKYGRSCQEVIAVRRSVQELTPEYALGWSVLADWNARCDRMDEAKALMGVASAMMGEDRQTGFLVAHHGALIHMVDLDLEGARPWMEMLRRTQEGQPDYHMLLALDLRLRGRFGEAMEATRRGLDAAAKSPGHAWTVLAASLVYSSLLAGDVGGATRVVDEFDRLFPDPADAGNRYGARMLRLAVEAARRPAPDRGALARRMEGLGAAVEKALEDAGRTEREAHESFLLSWLGDREACKSLIFRASPDKAFVGGCRARYAEMLLATGRAAEAAEQFRQAIREIAWVRFMYAEMVPAALLGRARALEAMGDREGARAVFRVLTTNYEHADREVPEVLEAREALHAPGAGGP